MTGHSWLLGWSSETLLLARLHDLVAAAWIEEKSRPDPVAPQPPPDPSEQPDPSSIEALKAFLE